MPAATALPAVSKTAVSPTPGQEYKLSDHPTAATGRQPNADLLAAVNRRAGVKPDATQMPGEPKMIPNQPPRPPADVPAAKPAAPAKFVPADELEPAAPAAATAAPDTKPAEPSVELMKSAPAQLRDAYERIKADRDTILADRDLTKKEAAEFRTKLKTYEDKVKSLEASETRAKELEQKLLGMDEQLRVTNYLQHPEFHEKYVRPVAEAMQSGIALVKDLSVESEDGNVRPGTDADFHEILAQPNTTLAGRKAKELFGEFSTTVLEARQKVRAAQESQGRAVKDAGLKSQEWLKNQQDSQAAARANARAEFDRTANALADKYPTLYRPGEGDKEADTAHKSGQELAQVILDGRSEGMSQEQYLATVAKVYHRAASWPMHQLQMSRLQTEVETLKGKLAAYEKSTPDASSRQQPGGVRQDAGGVIVTSADDAHNRLVEAATKRAGVRR